jgi:hypothetical protein
MLHAVKEALTKLELVKTHQNTTEVLYELDLTKITERHKSLLCKTNHNNKSLAIQEF